MTRWITEPQHPVAYALLVICGAVIALYSPTEGTFIMAPGVVLGAMYAYRRWQHRA